MCNTLVLGLPLRMNSVLRIRLRSLRYAIFAAARPFEPAMRLVDRPVYPVTDANPRDAGGLLARPVAANGVRSPASV
jgi:hypothetical protein